MRKDRNAPQLFVALVVFAAAAQPAAAMTFPAGGEPGQVPLTWYPSSAPDFQSAPGSYRLSAIGNAGITFVEDEEIDATSIRIHATVYYGRGAVGALVRASLAAPSGYIGVLDTCATLHLYRVDPLRVVELGSARLGFTADEEVVVQLDAVEDRLALRAWRWGESMPAEPQVSAVDATHSRGRPGIVHLPESVGDGSISAFRFVRTSASPLSDSHESFVRGDANADGALNLTDAIAVFRFLFQGGTEPGCEKAADTNDSGRIELADGIVLLNQLFRGVSLLSLECETDRTDDELGCDARPACLTSSL